MASLFLYRQAKPISVQFGWKVGESPNFFEVQQRETPYVCLGDVAPGQLDVGKVINVTLPNGLQKLYYVAGIRFCTGLGVWNK